MGKLKGAWDWLTGKKDVIQASWMRTQISSAVGGVGAAESNSASDLLTRAWAWLSEKYAGISQGVEAQKLIDWFPYIQGMVEAMIFAIFPFVLMASLFPGGWKALVHYFGAVLWVKSWTFFAVLISAVLDFCTATTIAKSSAALDVAWDLTGLRWVASMMIAAVPIVSYIAIFGGVGGLGSLDFQPRGTETASMIVRQGAQQVAGTFRGGGGSRPAPSPSPGK